MDHFAMKVYTGQQDIWLLKFILTSLPQWTQRSAQLFK